MTDDNLQAAIDATQRALGAVRVLVAENLGDTLYFSTENSLAATALSLITRQVRSTPPPMDPVTAGFFGTD